MSGRSPEDAADRRVTVLVAAAAFLFVLEGALVLASAPAREGRAAPSPTGSSAALPSPPSGKPGSNALELETLRKLSPEAAAQAGAVWARQAARDGDITDREVRDILPSAAFFLARTSSDSDVADILESADGANAFARAYKTLAEAIRGSNAAGARVEAALASVYAARTGGALGSVSFPSALHPPVQPGQRWIAPRADLRKTHQHALDIFFMGGGDRGGAERWPAVRSMSPGLVVATADDWVGGEGADKYRRGGLTPRAGNGAVVFDPETGRYYTYLHLADVAVRPGQLVRPGDVLGRGGNTGTNARKHGHGGHLHLEIYDAPSNRALSCYELRDLVVSL